MQLRPWQRVRITAVMAIAFTAEHADTLLLSNMYLAIGRSLDISVIKLGTLTMWRALVQVCCCSTLLLCSAAGFLASAQLLKHHETDK